MNNTRYLLTHSTNVPNAGSQPIRVGIPVPQHMVNDICICCRGSLDFIPVNSFVLREALLANPELTEHLLGVKVTDALIPEEHKEVKPSKKKTVVELKPEEIKEELK